MRKNILFNLSARYIWVLFLLVSAGASCNHSDKSPSRESVGKAIFFDVRLSSPPGQSCASCHRPEAAFTDDTTDLPTSEGAVAGIFGKRQTASIKYLAFSPDFHFDSDAQDFIGGIFWDGRARNLKEQAKIPFLSSREMNNTSLREVVFKVMESTVSKDFKSVYGERVFDDEEKAFDNIADALSAFEMSDELSPFTSKYDYYLRGHVALSPTEARGLRVFEDPLKGNCAACHPSGASLDGTPPLFTDFSYDNLGVPKNRNNPFYHQLRSNNPDGVEFLDRGLEITTGRPEDMGRMKVPTLRNIAVTPPYFHNGVFRSLEEVVRFYNERDHGNFEPPEISETMNRDELGDLRLSDTELADLVAFLRTLTDGYKIPQETSPSSP